MKLENQKLIDEVLREEQEEQKEYLKGVMTVGELIERLKKFPKTNYVLFYDGNLDKSFETVEKTNPRAVTANSDTWVQINIEED